jgi:protein ImuA
MQGPEFVQLRRAAAKLERPAMLEGAAGMLAFGIPEIDTPLGGGLAGDALHEIAAVSESHIAAVSGFALALTALKTERRRTAVWIAQDIALLESGAPCGLGLDEFALAPERLITVTTSRTRDLLWSMEEALRSAAVDTVIGELRGGNIDPVALRRLSLAAAANGAFALLLRTAPSAEASTAATRWIVGAAPSLSRLRQNYRSCAVRLNTQLVRNRRGPLGNWILEWSATDERFFLASTHPQPVAFAPVDRSAQAAVA